MRFTRFFPACYSGRWPHIHFEVYPDQASITSSTKAIATSRVALPEDICKAVYARPGYSASVTNLARVTLQSDNVFGDDVGASQLAVDTTTAPTGRRGAGRRRSGGTPPSGAPGA